MVGNLDTIQTLGRGKRNRGKSVGAEVPRVSMRS